MHAVDEHRLRNSVTFINLWICLDVLPLCCVPLPIGRSFLFLFFFINSCFRLRMVHLNSSFTNLFRNFVFGIIEHLGMLILFIYLFDSY